MARDGSTGSSLSGDPRDEAKRAFGADEQMLEVVAGAGLHHARQLVHHPAVGQDDLQPEDAVAHVAVAEGQEAAGIGRDHAAQRGRAAGRQVDARIEALGARGTLQCLERHAGLHDRGQLQRVEALDRRHAGRRYDHLPWPADSTAHEPGAPTMRHHGDTLAAAPADHGGSSFGRGWQRHHPGTEIARIPAGIAALQLVRPEHGEIGVKRSQLLHQFHGTRLPRPRTRCARHNWQGRSAAAAGRRGGRRSPACPRPRRRP